MEWIENPKFEFNNDPKEPKICTFGLVAGCVTAGLLCGSLCLIN